VPVPVVFIAAGASFPDALGAGSAAAAHCFLTAKSSVPSVVRT
jgi:hypothetical protein